MAATGDNILEPDVALEHDDFDTESIGSDYTSIASSIARYRQENGRTYHSFKDGKYLGSNDNEENNRLDMQHHIYALTLDNKVHLAPIKDIKRALDIGTGTGAWAIDFADDHPEAEVVGIDLSPIQPKFVPPNVQFLVDDAEAEWTYTHKFDFIYARILTGSIRDWPHLFKQAYENLNPGGWIEIADPIYPMECDDDTASEDCPLIKWSALCNEAASKIGAPIDTAKKYKDQLAEAGFINITETDFRWPLSPWAKDRKHKELGMWNQENHMTAIKTLIALFTRVLGWTPEEYEVFLMDVRKDLKDKTKHIYHKVRMVYAQKPEK